jgi:hypothetical protein
MWSSGGMTIGENLRTQREPCPTGNFVHHKSYMIDFGGNTGLPGEKPATNSLSCDTVITARLELTA